LVVAKYTSTTTDITSRLEKLAPGSLGKSDRAKLEKSSNGHNLSTIPSTIINVLPV
jgi:hypothetical protein